MFEGELLLGLRRHRRRRGWRGGGEARLELTQVLSSSGKQRGHDGFHEIPEMLFGVQKRQPILVRSHPELSLTMTWRIFAGR